MSVITQGPGYLTVRYDEEVDDDHTGSAVEKIRIDARAHEFIVLDAWAEGQSLDIALKRLVGYAADESEILADVYALAAQAAAADPNAPLPATEIAELENAAIPGGIYVVLAKRTGATAAGTLHVFGTVR